MAGEMRQTIYGDVAADFIEDKLQDLCYPDLGIQTGPFGSQLHQEDYVAVGTPIITVEHLGENRILHQGVPRVSDADRDRLSRYLLQSGDIVFSRVGSVDRRALVRPAEDGWMFSGRCLRVRPNPKKIDSAYLSYFFGLPAFKEHIRAIAVGATMPSLNTSILSDIVVPHPADVGEQHAIAHILGTLDEKIELSRRMNETLEAMARALFKSWFVDFDPVRAKTEGRESGLPKPIANVFPDDLEDSEFGDIPSGWTTSPVYDIATYINGAAYRDFQPNQKREGLPIIKIAELKAGVSAQTAFSTVEMPEKYRINVGDILFSWSGNPDTSIDTFVWADGPAWLNQHIFRVLPPSEETRAFVLMTLRYLRPMFAEIARNKQTTGLGHVTAADLKRLLVVVPPKSVLLHWNSLIEPLIERSFGLALETNTLASLRDALLPKLISGELRVKEAERAVEVVA